jgi:hypothetical protein
MPEQTVMPEQTEAEVARIALQREGPATASACTGA